MIVRMGLLKKRHDLTNDQFRRHWRDVHAPLAARMTGLFAYHQNHVIDSRHLGIDYARGAWEIDGFSELWFESETAMQKAIGSHDEYDPQRQDLPKFADEVRIVSLEQRTVVPPRRTAKRIKRMSFLRRADHISAEQFRHEWFEVHAPLVKAFPTLLGYRQNLILTRETRPGAPSGYDAIPADGIVELWFEDEAALEQSFAHEAATRAQAHAREFIAEITPFLVDVIEVV